MKRMSLLLNIFVLLVFAGCSNQARAVVPSLIPSMEELPVPSPTSTLTLPLPSPIPYQGSPFPLQKPSRTLPVPSHVYAFGDSYSDNGNFYKLDPSAFDSYNWQGRSSNGPVAVEVFANQLGVELTDYAVGGAKSNADNVNGGEYRNTGMLTQIEKFKTGLDGKGADPEALYFIMIGACDYLEKTIGVTSIDNPTLVDQVVGNIAKGISELAQLGARRFLVIGLENLTILPGVKLVGSAMQEDAADFQSLMDSKLTNRITELTTQLGIDITYFDTLALSNQILKNPSDYGLTNITDACTDLIPICANPDQYYIWDTYHPTRRVHEIFGRTMAALYDNG
jgi:phospholipase/lecithinase/hemolysin